MTFFGLSFEESRPAISRDSLSKSVLMEKRNIVLLGLATSCGFWRVFRFVNISAVVATANSDQFLFSVHYYPRFPNFPDTLF